MNDKNTYPNYAVLRAVSALVCIFGIFYDSKKSGLFYSPYDWILCRVVFHSEGGFWTEMDKFMIFTFLLAAVMLFVNAFSAGAGRREGAITDMIIYGVLVLVHPIYIIVAIVSSRSILTFTMGQLLPTILFFLYFLFALVFTITLYGRNRKEFIDFKTSKNPVYLIMLLAAIAVFIIPVLHLKKAISIGTYYSPNYGKFEAKLNGANTEDEDNFGNWNNHGYIYKDSIIYYKGRYIYKVDPDGGVSTLYEFGKDTKSIVTSVLKMDVFEDKIYTVTHSRDEGEDNWDIHFSSIDIETGIIEEIFTMCDMPPYTDVTFFKVKDDCIYYAIDILGQSDNSINYIDLSKEHLDSEVFVSDIYVTPDYYPYIFMYNYNFIKLGFIAFSYDTFEPYKENTYYTKGSRYNDGSYKYSLEKQTYDPSSKELYVREVLSEDGGYQFNIYKDRIYFYQDEYGSGRAAVYSMNLDGSDFKYEAEYQGDDIMYISAICVTDDFIMVDIDGRGIDVVSR